MKPTKWKAAQHTLRSTKRILVRPGRRVLEPAMLFAVLASVFGLATLVVMPPYMVPDEQAHIYRAYQVSEGGLFSANQDGMTGGYLPRGLQEPGSAIYGSPQLGIPYREYLVTDFETSDRKFIAFDSTAVYSPASYAPQAAGILLARLIHPSNLAVLYMARLFNLIAFIAMLVIAIRLVPVGKWLFVAVGLLPMSLHQAASASSDVMTIGIAFIAIAYGIRLWLQETRIDRQQFITILLIGALLGLTKQSNVALILPFLLLPARMFASAKQRIGFISSLIAASVGAMLIWYVSTRIAHYNFDYSGNPAVDMATQLSFVLHHPLEFAEVLIRTFLRNNTALPPQPDFYWQSLVGVFSWISYQLPLIGTILAYLLLFTALLYRPASDAARRSSRTFGAVGRLTFATAFIASLIAIAGILYLAWTPVGAPVVAGIQGRYFIPLLPLLIPIFYTSQFRLSFGRSYIMPLAVIIIAGLNVATMLTLTIDYFHL